MKLFRTHRWLSIPFALLLLLIGLGGTLKLARAHAEYDRSDPAADAVLAQAPAEVHIWFAEELFRREGVNTLAVFGPTGEQVDQGDARIDDDDRTHLLVSLADGLPEGQYTVRWHSLSLDDGDEDDGEFGFTVGAAPAVAATSAPAAEQSAAAQPAASGSRTWPCVSGFILGGLALGAVFVSQKHKSGAS